MAEAEAENLAQIIRALHSPQTSDHDRSAAIAMLEEKEHSPTTIIPCLHLIRGYTGAENNVIRQMAAIMIGHVLECFLDKFAPSDLAEVKRLFLEAIRTEEVWLVRKNLCEASVKAVDPKKGMMWPELLQFARSCLEVPMLFSTGLYIIYLEMKQLIDVQEMEAISEFLVKTCIEAFGSEDVNVRIVAINLMDAIIWHPGDVDQFAEMICGALLEQLKRAFFVTKDPDECMALAKAIVELTTHPKDSYKQYSAPCTQLALELIANKELDWRLRVIAYKILGDDSGTDGGMFELLEDNVERILEYLNVCIELSLMICREDRSNPMFEFPTSFLHNAGATVDGDVIFTHIWNVCHEISAQGDIASRQEALFLLSCIVESQQEGFADNIRDVTEFIFQIGDEMDEDLAKYAARVIQELAEYVPDAVTVFVDELAGFLLKRVQWVEPLQALDKVLDAAAHPPRDFDNFMRALLTILSKGDLGMQTVIIDCIASCISRIQKPIEPFYPSIMPVLTQAMKNDYLKGGVMRCIGNLSGTAPLAMKADIATIVQLFGAAMATADFPFCTVTVNALEKVATNLSMDLLPHLKPLIEGMLSLLQKNNEVSSDPTNQSFYYATMTCFATFFRFFPEQMKELSPVFMNSLSQASQTADKALPYLCQAIQVSAEGMMKLGIGLESYLSPIMEKLKTTMDKKHIICIHQLVGDLLRIYGSALLRDETEIEKIKTCLTNGIDCTAGEGYMMCELSSCVDITILPHIFYALKEFIHTVGTKVNDLLDAIVPVLLRCLSNGWDLYKGYPVEIFAQISTFIGVTDIYTLAYSHAVSFLTKMSNWTVQVCTMNALRYLLLTNKEPFVAEQEQMFEYVDRIVKSCASGGIDNEPLKQASIALWTTMVMELGISPPEDGLNVVLEALPPECDTEWIPVAGRFIVHAMTQWPEVAKARFPYIAAAILSCSNWMLARVPPDVLVALKGVMAQLPESDWPAFVLNYQGRLLKLIETMRKPS